MERATIRRSKKQAPSRKTAEFRPFGKEPLECLDAFCHEGAKIEELELELLHYGSMRPRQEGAALDIGCPFWDRIAAMNPVGGV